MVSSELILKTGFGFPYHSACCPRRADHSTHQRCAGTPAGFTPQGQRAATDPSQQPPTSASPLGSVEVDLELLCFILDQKQAQNTCRFVLLTLHAESASCHTAQVRDQSPDLAGFRGGCMNREVGQICIPLVEMWSSGNTPSQSQGLCGQRNAHVKGKCIREEEQLRLKSASPFNVASIQLILSTYLKELPCL